ncbi:hypothetical protein, partial [Streptomyces stramineus]|uniref:hypothetical protein n=1 Tax=Streptomyces stramineus TaxID=173861 RepID=UPI0031D2FBB0
PKATAATPWTPDSAAPGAPQQSSPPVDDWPVSPSTTAATPWPADGAAGAPGTGSASPVDDWPVSPSPATGTPGAGTGGAPWVREGSVPTAAQQQAQQQQNAQQQPAAPVDDWPAGPVAGTPQWQADASAARAARGSGSQVDDWPGASGTAGSAGSSGPSAPGGAGGAGAPWQGVPSDGMSTTGATPWPGEPATPQTTGSTPWPVDPMATGTNPIMQSTPPMSTGAPAWNDGADSTQQFPAPTMDQGTATPFAAPAGGAAFAGGRTDTPREGTPRVPAPNGGAPAPAGKQQPKGGGKGGKGGGKKGGPKPPAAGGQAGGQTRVRGVPAVPPPPGPGRKAAAVDSGAPRVPVPKPKVPGPGAAAPAAQSAPKSAPKAAPKAAPKKQGRSKLVLLGGGLVGLVAVAYGAGLALDHADVPKGTTVLGVAIGGSSKEDAVQKLDTALGDRAAKPLKVSIGGKEAQLKPAVAGLSIDTQATVRAAAGRDYNPLTVIGSLVGGGRTAEAEIVADEEKIASALKALAGESGSSKDGTIKFEPGKAVPVYGQAYEGVDTDSAVKTVAQAYRDRAATGEDKPVTLPSSHQQPKVSNAEVDRMMKDFAKPAMSGLVTVQVDAAHKIQFGPDRSLPKILAVKEVGGKLVDNYNLEALKELYGTAFNGVLIQRGDGTKTPVQPTDVVGPLRKALLGKTPAERIATIPVNGS